MRLFDQTKLDEMQEQKLLHIEHRAFWLTYGALLLVIFLELLFGGKAGRNSALTPVMNEVSHDKRTVMIPVESVDHVLNGAPCTLLKLDVEGAERMALEGARHTIEKYQPRISLSAYHRSEDLYELPLLLRDMCADVRLGMRHHPYVPAWETNFYVTFG